MQTMTLWTRQVPQVWQQLQQTGCYTVKADYIKEKNGSISDYYLELYRWYTREARKHFEIPAGLDFPIWLCVDESNMLQPVENSVILKIEAPWDKVLLCNYEAWGYRVNYWYVPTDKRDEQAHRAELARYGLHSDDELINTHLGSFYPLLTRKIKSSWSRVFTQMDVPQGMLCATMW